MSGNITRGKQFCSTFKKRERNNSDSEDGIDLLFFPSKKEQRNADESNVYEEEQCNSAESICNEYKTTLDETFEDESTHIIRETFQDKNITFMRHLKSYSYKILHLICNFAQTISLISF